jgi:hypothetical protein
MTLPEGARVSYVGYGTRDGLALEDSGKVLLSSATASHVLMATGQRSGDICLVANDDLVVTRAASTSASELDDSLSEGSLVTTAARDTFDRYGSVGLINALNAEGVLSCFDGIAEEALGLVAARIRHDPAIRCVLAELDDEDAEEVVQHATATLLRDAFGYEGD